MLFVLFDIIALMSLDQLLRALKSYKGTTSSACSVTARIRQVKQPRGGYINPKNMTVIKIGDGEETLNPYEHLHPSLIGLAVDYLTRFMLGEPVEKAFMISLKGASLIGEQKAAQKYMSRIDGLNRRSVINAVKLCGYDVIYRAGVMGYKPVTSITPDYASIENIMTMVERSLQFFEDCGPIVMSGFTFEGGYTNIIGAGDGDFTTKDTLWDFKVSKNMVKKEHTLQLLIYWRMGLHSIHPGFEEIKYLGVYNPRLNTVYKISVEDIPENIIREVETDIIGY